MSLLDTHNTFGKHLSKSTFVPWKKHLGVVFEKSIEKRYVLRKTKVILSSKLFILLISMILLFIKATTQNLMKVAALFAIFFLTLCSVKGIHGETYCLECSDVPSARDCDTIKMCDSHEVCYSSQVVSSTGHIYRTMGCRDRMQCSSAIVGKRSDVRDISSIIVCDGCCDTTFCQSKLCQDQDYLADRGPICFRCENQLPTEGCTHINECTRDEVCVSSSKLSPSGHMLMQTGCFGKLLCDRSGNVTTTNACFSCCHGDLCNTPCSTLPSNHPTVTTPPCVDTAPHSTCKLAELIVCKDRTHAHNAGCMHYCGFC